MHDDDFHLESEHEHDHDAADSSYSDRQRSRDANYQRDYDRWVKSLPPEERRKLAGMGLGKAEVSHKAGSGFKDLTDSPLCSTPPGEMLSNDDPQLDAAVMPEGESPHEILRRLIGELMHQDHSRLALDCLALVTGLAYEGDSMTEIALRHDVTRAAVSKRCVELTLALNLEPSRAMRSLAARTAYRQSRNHHMKTKDPLGRSVLIHHKVAVMQRFDLCGENAPAILRAHR